MSETGYSLKEIADFLDAELFGDPSLRIIGICSLNNPIKDHITFLSEQKKEHLIKDTKASAIIVSKEINNDVHKNLLQVNDPYLAYAKVTQLFLIQMKFHMVTIFIVTKLLGYLIRQRSVQMPILVKILK